MDHFFQIGMGAGGADEPMLEAVRRQTKWDS
jgi:hypothetical protein